VNILLATYRLFYCQLVRGRTKNTTKILADKFKTCNNIILNSTSHWVWIITLIKTLIHYFWESHQLIMKSSSLIGWGIAFSTWLKNCSNHTWSYLFPLEVDLSLHLSLEALLIWDRCMYSFVWASSIGFLSVQYLYQDRGFLCNEQFQRQIVCESEDNRTFCKLHSEVKKTNLSVVSTENWWVWSRSVTCHY
jgi:hypothetical protein